jgi:transcriptional regulator with XRE-family HTH domain
MSDLPSCNSSQVKKAMTNADVQASFNLKKIWERYKSEYVSTDGESMTQKIIAARMGWSQSNFSQYLNGIVPIGRKAAQTMAEVFGCSATDIRPDYSDAQVIEQNTQLISMLHEMLDVLSKLRTGEADINKVHLTALSLEDRVPGTLLQTA